MVKSIWKGYDRFDYTFDGRDCIVVAPKANAEGNPWIWRTEFFDAFSQADMALLAEGWHVAYYRVSEMYGCPESIELLHKFYKDVVVRFDLSSKADIFGFSRGGLYAVNYCASYPDTVSILYLDAPVLDIKSWPGGLGTGCGAEKEWQECLDIYKLNEETVKCFKDNPLDKTDILKCPIILVAGDSDNVVPYSENGEVLVQNYKNNELKVIVKRGIGHHPHSLEDPKEIVDFIKKYK